MTMGGMWVCDACHSLNDHKSATCYKCRVKRGQAKPQPIIPGATVGHAVSDYLGAPVGDSRGEPSLIGGFFAGATVAVLMTGLWYYFEAGIHILQGRAAVVIGVLIGVAVVVGGTLGNKRVSFMLAVISFLLTLAAIVIGEYLIISAGLVSGTAATFGVRMASPEQIGAAIAEYWASDPLRPILWIAALAAGWLVPFGALVANTDEG